MRYAHHTGPRPAVPVLGALVLGALALALTAAPAAALAGPAPPPMRPALPDDKALPNGDASPNGDISMSGDLTARGARIFHGRGFDTCEAPALPTMRDWLASPYRALGIYVGGKSRACAAQPHLTPDWVRDVSALGWRLLPIYAGSQSPCISPPGHSAATIGPEGPRAQGAAEAKDAVFSARALGLAPGSPIYLDIEDYDHHDPDCAADTLAFVQGFTRHLADEGWIAGYYSSATSGIAHLENARRAGAPDLPDALWYARWGAPPTLDAEPSLDPAAWQPHRRIHQYAGDVAETHGGRRLLIDRNLVHAPVAVLAGAPEGVPAPGIR